MLFSKTIQVNGGLTVSFHKLTRVEAAPDMRYLFLNIGSWVSEAQYQTGVAPVYNKMVSVPVMGELEQELTDSIVADDYLLNATVMPDPLQTLEYKKALVWAQTKAFRDQLEYGSVQFAGTSFDADKDSQRRILGSVAAALLPRIEWLVQTVQALCAQAGINPPAQPSFAMDWTAADNNTVSLSGEQMIGLGLALAQQISVAHATARSQRALIEGATEETLPTIEPWPQQGV